MKMEGLKQEISLMRIKLESLIYRPATPPELVFKAARMLSRLMEIQLPVHQV